MRALSLFVIALTCSLVTLVSARAQNADLVLRNGHIYTVNTDQPSAQAIAVTDGAIVFVGSDTEANEFVGPATQVVDLQGRMAMPGLHDAHVHLLEAFHFGFTCVLNPGVSPETYIQRLRQCAPQQLGSNWVIGFGHAIEDMLEHIEAGGRSPVEILDEAIPNRPAVMMESTSHSMWVNSLALTRLGFDESTLDPVGGVILRDAGTNTPNGLLLDAAGELAMDVAFRPNAVMRQLNYRALLTGLQQLARNGITSFCDARVYWRRGYVDAYRRVQANGELSARGVLGLWAYPYLDDDSQIAALINQYDNDPESMLRVSQVKIYSDGEVSHTTAALLEPYISETLGAPDGLNYFDQTRMNHYVSQLEAAGFDMHVHAIGDRGVNEALNAVESARGAHGNLGRRHRLTHVEVIAPTDVPRFAELDVIPDIQMSSAFVLPQFTIPFYTEFLGQNRAEARALRLRDIYDSGARVVMSSDYDVGSLSPFVGMQRSLTRGDQSLPNIDAAIRAYTINAAYLMQQDTRVGSLEVGKRADITIIDRDITQIPPQQIGQTQVLATLLDGQFVYEAPGLRRTTD